MRTISTNRYQPHNSISVLEQDNHDQDSDDFETCESDVYCDRSITREEVLLAIQRLKNGKAAGPDGIIVNYLSIWTYGSGTFG